MPVTRAGINPSAPGGTRRPATANTPSDRSAYSSEGDGYSSRYRRGPVELSLLLHTDREPQSPEEWQQWLATTRRAIRKHAIATSVDLGKPDEPAALHLMHAHCPRRFADGASPALLPASGPSRPA
jgi:hypothetical protein